jgi:hypothetical protein
VQHIITILKATSLRRKGGFSAELSYEAAAARAILGRPFYLDSLGLGSGYVAFFMHSHFIHEQDFNKFIEIYETDKAIETLLGGQEDVTIAEAP